MKAIITLGFAALLLCFTACGDAAKPEAKKYKYVCTMHPDIGADKPGTCGKCGMELVEREE